MLGEGSGIPGMSQVDDSIPSVGNQPVTPSLARRTFSGFLWSLTQFAGNKVVAIVSQIVLALRLLPEHFGDIALAMTVVAMPALLYRSGLREVLIHRQAKFDRWCNAAFWMAVGLGLLSTLLTLGIAPLAARIYEAPQVMGLILVLALAEPFEAIAIIPEAALSGQLRFRQLAAPTMLLYFAQIEATIGLAARGFGAYSFAIPTPLAMAARLCVLWWLARPRVRWALQVRRWMSLLSDSSMVMATGLCNNFIGLGDRMVLGIWHSPAVVGVYSFSYNLSIQSMLLLASNTSAVLFPALSKLQDDVNHQTRAFLRVCRLLAMITIPMCLVQAAVTAPLVRVLFKAEWQVAIPVLQVLTVGAALRVVGGPAINLLQAQGRFRMILVSSATIGALFMMAVTIGALVGAAVSVAVAGTIGWTLLFAVLLRIAIAPGGGRWRDIFALYTGPLLLGSIAAISGMLVSRWLPAMHRRDWAEIVTTTAVAGAAYLAMVRVMMPATWGELIDAMKHFRR